MIAQDRPKIAPRGAQSEPKRRPKRGNIQDDCQERKSCSSRPSWSRLGLLLGPSDLQNRAVAHTALVFSKITFLHKNALGSPTGQPKVLKKTPRWHLKTTPNRPGRLQERPKMDPRAAQERPRATQERPTEAQGRAGTAKMGSRAGNSGPRRPRIPQRAPQDRLGVVLGRSWVPPTSKIVLWPTRRSLFQKSHFCTKSHLEAQLGNQKCRKRAQDGTPRRFQIDPGGPKSAPR